MLRTTLKRLFSSNADKWGINAGKEVSGTMSSRGSEMKI
jgi:hypothetical protein